jgi:hypothetical protein
MKKAPPQIPTHSSTNNSNKTTNPNTERVHTRKDSSMQMMTITLKLNHRNLPTRVAPKKSKNLAKSPEEEKDPSSKQVSYLRL